MKNITLDIIPEIILYKSSIISFLLFSSISSILLKSFIKSQMRLNKSSNFILVILFILSSSHVAEKISFKYISNKSKIKALISSIEVYLFSVDIF